MDTVLNESEDQLTTSEFEEEIEDSTESASAILSLGKRLVFPTLALIFVALYIRNTWGKISFSNLWYPYFIISCILTLLVTIYVSEILDVYRNLGSYSATFVADALKTYREWKLSISILAVALIYLASINHIGFFPASFVTMAVMMRIGGIKKWRIIIPTCVGVLIFTYIMFIMVLGVRPPSGPLQVL